jgi:predicted protein tyrosine phosphatase
MPERFSWILPNKLAVGSFPKPTTSVMQLRRLGVTAVLCLTEESERPISTEVFHSFLWERVSMPDGFTGGIPTEEQFADALQILSRWYRKGHVIYVHCLAGVGRSPSVCAAYLVQSQGMSLEEAIGLVRERHPYAAPDANQVQVMKSFFQG